MLRKAADSMYKKSVSDKISDAGLLFARSMPNGMIKFFGTPYTAFTLITTLSKISSATPH